MVRLGPEATIRNIENAKNYLRPRLQGFVARIYLYKRYGFTHKWLI